MAESDRRTIDVAGAMFGCIVAIAAVIGFIFGALTGMGASWDLAISIGKSLVRWNTDTIQLETCAAMMREGTLAHETQINACAYFIEKTAQALKQ